MLNEIPARSSLHVFVSAGGMHRFELDLPEIRESHCVGSTGCWLVMDGRASNLYLLNPLSRAKIDLPKVCSLGKEGVYSDPEPCFLFSVVDFSVKKVVLSFVNSDSGSHFDFVAMAIFDQESMVGYDSDSTLAYTRKGANLWQALEFPGWSYLGNGVSFLDILFYDGQFYALDCRGILYKCPIDCIPPKLVQCSDELEIEEIYFRARYLVEFCRIILQVVKISERIDGGHWTEKFRVFMFDYIAGGWVETYHLGEYSLFLDCHTSSVAILSSSSINLKPSCIYFSDVYNLGVYNLRDSTVVIDYPRFAFAPSHFPGPWIVPTSLSVRPVSTSLSVGSTPKRIMEEEKKSKEEMRNWSGLPRDVLAVIAGRLKVGTDRVRFSAVCRNWSSVAKSEINYLPCSPPWLMLSEKPDGSGLFVFVSADGKENFELDLPEIRRSQCVSSTGCWVVMDDLSRNLYLLNPLSRAKIDLPPMSPKSSFHYQGEYSVTDTTNLMFTNHYISEKVVLSFLNSDPNFDFVAMAVFDDTRRLAYTKKGAKSWQALDFSECRDVIFFKEKFYALDRRGFLFECLIDSCPPKVVMISRHSKEIYCRERMYLVEFCGVILQVVKIIEGYVCSKYTTVGFRVFMFDFTTGRWMEIYDLGEYSLFLGCNTSVAILSSCSINLKPNCIYFTDEIRVMGGKYCRFVHGSDFGVYDLHDSTIVRCSFPKFTPYRGEFWVAKSSPPLWIVPTSLSVTPDHGIVPTSLSVTPDPTSLLVRSSPPLWNWSELPRDVLVVIAGRLTVGIDRVRFSAVCRNWSSVAKSEIDYLPCRPPWLMLDEKPNGSSLHVFVSAGGMQRFELDLPEIRKSQCVGSTRGWLVMVDLSGNLYFLNPLSRAKIDLPQECSFGDEGVYLSSIVDFSFEKVVLSFINSDSVSGSDFDFVAMAVFDEYGMAGSDEDSTAVFHKASTLAYTRKGANLWQALEFTGCSFLDIVFSDGQFYALDSLGILYKCQIDCSPPKVVRCSDELELEEIYCEGRYLVENYVMILQVVKYIEWNDEGEYPLPVFRVFMFIIGEWVETSYLGAYSLVLGCNTSVAILSSSSVNLKPNCIYFTEDFIDVGVYNLGDSTVVIDDASYAFTSSHIPCAWIVPLRC